MMPWTVTVRCPFLCGEFYTLRSDEGVTLFEHMRIEHNADRDGSALDARGVIGDMRFTFVLEELTHLAPAIAALKAEFPCRVATEFWGCSLYEGREWPKLEESEHGDR